MSRKARTQEAHLKRQVTAERDDRIVACTLQGMSSAEVAQELDLGQKLVQNRLVFLRQEGAVKSLRRAWEPEESSRLWRMFYGGKSDAEIAIALDRSAQSILMQRHKMRLRRDRTGRPVLA